MCDLHRNTLPHPTPRGAIARQMEIALSDSDATWVKLYNSGNFFDPNSIPPSDYIDIAERCSGLDRVIVENHPRFGLERLRKFNRLLQPRLEVAVGLETVQPRWLGRMNKSMSRDDFGHYASKMRQLHIDLRVFLILGVPGIDTRESFRWTRLSVRHAVACGARHISIIPARSGHGWKGEADRLPTFTLDQLADLHHDAIADADGRAAVTFDLWDIDPKSPRRAELQHANLHQTTWSTT